MPKTFLFRPKWYMGKAIEEEIKKLLIGKSLNFPCGKSSFGDVRADIDPKVKPDILEHLQSNPFINFRKFSFDTIFCDPPI